MENIDVLDRAARESANRYVGDFAWPTVLLGCAVFLAYIATPLLVVNNMLPLVAAVPLMVLLTYAAYTVMHEAVHGSISGSNPNRRWVNELMGYMAGQVFMVPLTAHRHEHLAHHRNTNSAEDDPDYRVSGMFRSPLHSVRVAVTLMAASYSYYLKHRWKSAPRSQNIRLGLEIASAISIRLLFMAQGYWLEGMLLFVVGGIGGAMLLMYLFAYLPHHPYTATGRYVDTAAIVVPGPLGKVVTALWGFQNYHAIHHLFPRVPFYRYRQLFEGIEPTLVAKGAPIYQLSAKGLLPRTGFDSGESTACVSGDGHLYETTARV